MIKCRRDGEAAVIVPEVDEIGLDILTSNMRTAGMARKRFFELLARC